MKILILTHSLNTGGAERVGADIANGLAEIGWEVTVMANNKGKITYPLISKVNLIWFTEDSSPLKRRWKVFNQLKTFLNSQKPDIVVEILHVFPHELLLARKISSWQCPLIITEHDSFERPRNAKMSRYLYYKKWILDRFFDGVTVLTQADANFIGSRLKGVKVMYNPLFLKPVSEIPKKENVILAVGRLDAWYIKGFDILIKSWIKIASKYPDWKLRIIGSGNERSKAYLVGLADCSDQIEFSDYTINIVEEYRKAAIYCLSSRYEGWGLVMVEAMSQGCATIACDYKGRQAECITNMVDGIICPPDNVEILREKIDILISNENLRYKLQKEAVETSKKFTRELIIREWNDYLISVIESNKSL